MPNLDKLIRQARILLAFAILTLGATTEAFAQCTISASPTLVAYDNQGSTTLSAGTVALSPLQMTITATAGCGTWTITPQNNSFVPNVSNPPTLQWFQLNPVSFTCGSDCANPGAPVYSCGPGHNGSSSAQYTGTHSVQILVCPNPIPMYPMASLGPLAGSLLVTGTGGQLSIPVNSAMTQQIFSDVPPSAYYFDYLNLLAKRGIYQPPTSGSNVCSSPQGSYNGCPTANINRDEMAQWIVRAIYGGDNFSYTQTPAYFTDVPCWSVNPSCSNGNPFFPWIQAMADLGITTGCATKQYCPSVAIPRDQMAVFIIRARFGGLQSFDSPATPYFTDVPANAFGFPWIQRLRYDYITAGCTVNMFCPSSSIDRGDLSIFVARGILNTYLSSVQPLLTSAAPATVVGSTTGTPTSTAVTVSAQVINLPGSGTTVSLLGCGSSPVANCAASTPASSYTVSGNQVTATIKASNVKSVNTQPVPQSILVSYPDVPNDPRGVLPNGLAEFVLPNAVRVPDAAYGNLAVPATYLTSSYQLYPGWTEVMDAGTEVQQVIVTAAKNDVPTIIETSTPPFAGNASAGTLMTATPHPSSSQPYTATSSGLGGTAYPVITKNCEVPSIENYDQSHPVFYKKSQDSSWPWTGPGTTAQRWIENTDFTGDPANVPASGANLYIPKEGVKGIMVLGSFAAQDTASAAGGYEVYYTSVGCAGGDREYGFYTTTAESTASPGQPSNRIFTFYAQDYANCGTQANPVCWDQNYANAIYPGLNAVGANISKLSDPWSNPDLQDEGSYYWGMYLVADSSTQGYRFRVDVLDSGTFNAINCSVNNGPTTPCVFDLPITITPSGGLLAVAPDYATRLYNSDGYIIIGNTLSPNGGVLPSLNAGSKLQINGVWIAQ